ncbi:MAG: hypothetical protein ACRDP6_23995 [Actinoallomurus sp.]
MASIARTLLARISWRLPLIVTETVPSRLMFTAFPWGSRLARRETNALPTELFRETEQSFNPSVPGGQSNVIHQLTCLRPERMIDSTTISHPFVDSSDEESTKGGDSQGQEAN